MALVLATQAPPGVGLRTRRRAVRLAARVDRRVRFDAGRARRSRGHRPRQLPRRHQRDHDHAAGSAGRRAGSCARGTRRDPPRLDRDWRGAHAPVDRPRGPAGDADRDRNAPPRPGCVLVQPLSAPSTGAPSRLRTSSSLRGVELLEALPEATLERLAMALQEVRLPAASDRDPRGRCRRSLLCDRGGRGRGRGPNSRSR